MVREEICKDAIDLWGIDAQLDMVVEECSELIKAICKYKRSSHKEMDSLHIAEEHADVLIMLDQLSYIMSKHDPELIILIKRLRKDIHLIRLFDLQTVLIQKRG